MRLFIGLPVPVETARGLARLARAVELPKVRWTAPENIHITLVFLGEVAESRLSSIQRELSGLDAVAFQITVTRLDAFPRGGALFAEVDPAPRLLKLQAQVAEGMVRCGFAMEPRPYHPHITLARFRGHLKIDRGRLALTSQVERSFRVEAVNLYRSHSTAGGSVYEVLAQKKADVR